MNEVYLKDIGSPFGKKGKMYELPYIEITPSIRLFFDVRKGNKRGFYFYVIELTSEIELGVWDEEESEALWIIHGISDFDGINHLYYGATNTNNFGYSYYPNIPIIIRIFQELRKLEVKYCRNYS